MSSEPHYKQEHSECPVEIFVGQDDNCISADQVASHLRENPQTQTLQVRINGDDPYQKACGVLRAILDCREENPKSEISIAFHVEDDEAAEAIQQALEDGQYRQATAPKNPQRSIVLQEFSI